MPNRLLVEPAELADFLEIEESAYPVDALDPIRLGVVRFFERLTGRTRLPFSDAITGRVEYHDGTGSSLLMLDYPVGSLTALTIGANHSAPDETLVINDPAVLSVLAGDRAIERLDGGIFGELETTRAVKITYTTADDLPDDAKLACLRVIAQVWRQRGSEDAASETVSGYQRQMADLAAKDPLWVHAVEHHRRPVFV